MSSDRFYLIAFTACVCANMKRNAPWENNALTVPFFIFGHYLLHDLITWCGTSGNQQRHYTGNKVLLLSEHSEIKPVWESALFNRAAETHSVSLNAHLQDWFLFADAHSSPFNLTLTEHFPILAISVWIIARCVITHTRPRWKDTSSCFSPASFCGLIWKVEHNLLSFSSFLCPAYCSSAWSSLCN